MIDKQTWFEPGASPTRRFSIYLPSRKKDGEPVEDFENLATASLELLCEMFGGATSYPAKGIFKDKQPHLHAEEIRLLECFCRSQEWESHSRFLHAFLGLLAQMLDQESLACSLDGQIVFVPPGGIRYASLSPLSAKSLKGLVEKAMESAS